MIHVYELDLAVNDEPISLQTRVWITVSALEEFTKYQRQEQPQKKFIKKLKRYAKTGFSNFEGNDPIRYEGNGVFRISDGSLFRLYGFYENDSKTDFIVIDALLKRKTKISSSIRKRIDKIAQIKRDKLWTKKVV